MGKFTHVIFDLDGTLLDTIPELLFNMNKTFDELGLPGAFNEAEMASFIGSGKDEQIKRAMRARNIPLIKFEQINDLLSVYYAQNSTKRTKVFAGVNEVLTTLKANNIPLFIATNKPENIAIDVVNTFFGADMFSVIRGDKGDGIVKPNPRFLGSLVAALNVLPAHILFVGDSAVDYMSAKNALITCAIVPHGYDESVRAIKDEALINLESVDEILRLVVDSYV